MKRLSSTLKTALLATLLAATVYSCKKDNNNNSDKVIKTGIPVTVDQERPFPIGGPTGSGTVDIDYTKSTRMLMYTAKWNGLLDSVTRMHIHGPAVRDSIAPPVFGSNVSLGTSGTYHDMRTITAEQETQLLTGKFYFNLHTKANPAGEIRGQIEF